MGDGLVKSRLEVLHDSTIIYAQYLPGDSYCSMIIYGEFLPGYLFLAGACAGVPSGDSHDRAEIFLTSSGTETHGFSLEIPGDFPAASNQRLLGIKRFDHFTGSTSH